MSPDGSGPAPGGPSIAVIGAGFSGTMMALHLSEALPPGGRVLLCERDTFACGPAYATRNADHLLNVRAANMSAFPDLPGHFEQFLATDPDIAPAELHPTDCGAFASRGLYRRYLCSLLDRVAHNQPCRVSMLRDEVVDIARHAEGLVLHTATGQTRRVDAAILAIGNLPPPTSDHPLHCTNPWSPGALAGVRDDLPVLIVGTGLTMADLALELRAAGFPGPVIALSRRGLLPHPHAPSRPWPTPELSEAERGSLSLLLARMRWDVRRAAARGVDWRGVIDSYHPVTAGIWRGLPLADRRRFLRHVRPYWDIHRHRLAPPVAREVRSMLDSGYLSIRRGRVAGMTFADNSVTVAIRPRGNGGQQTLHVQRVINATGLVAVTNAESPLIGALLRRGVVRLDPLGLGLEATDGLALRDARGRPSADLWALGPIVRGMFWESVAVPDIRTQASELARSIAAPLQAARVA